MMQSRDVFVGIVPIGSISAILGLRVEAGAQDSVSSRGDQEAELAADDKVILPMSEYPDRPETTQTAISETNNDY